MKLFITTAVWGEKNCRLFAEYSLPTIRDVKATFHIQTTPYDRAWLEPYVAGLTVKWDLFDAPGASKYDFLSGLHNRAITASLDHDVIVFNYADFVWGEGSLDNTVKLLGGNDAVLTFCLPVDEAKGIAIKPPISNRDLAKFALDNLHIEATYRYWDSPTFTRFPSYLLFRVPGQGVIIRAYHQTALALKVKPGCELYRQGITNGTLDGQFTSDLASHGKIVHATDSDQIMVVSLHDGEDRTASTFNPNDALREFVKTRATKEQIRFVQVPIAVKVAEPTRLWASVEASSGDLVRY